MKKKTQRERFLEKGSGFLVGVGSVIDISGSLFDYNITRNPAKRDIKSIQMDWITIGKDISKAAKKFEDENNLCILK